MQIIRDVAYTQAFGTRFCLQIGSTAIMFGTVKHGRGPRLELLTPRHWFRWSKGYRVPPLMTPAEADAAYDAAPSIPMTDKEIQDIVAKVTSR